MQLSLRFAVAAVALFSASDLVLAGHLRRAHRGSSGTEYHARRDDGSAAPAVTETQLQQLQGYLTMYETWFNSAVSQLPATDPAAEQLKAQHEQYSSAIKQWMSRAMGGSAGAGAAASGSPSANAVSSPTGAAAGSAATSGAVASSSTASSAAPAAGSAAPAAGSGSAAPAAGSASSTAGSAAPAAGPAIASAAAAPSPAAGGAAPSAGIAAPSSGSSPAAYSNSTGSASSGAGLVAVYWGQGAKDSTVGLDKVCADPDFDIVNLAFLLDWKAAGGYPKIDFGSGCGGKTSSQKMSGAAGLLQCPQMATSIKACQKAGKKVLLSIGGEAGTAKIDFASQSDATAAADQVWNLFGKGTGSDKGLRPFGDVVLDGFDIDDENKKPQYYTDFVSKLRTNMKTDSSKKYLITAAPQCPRPDASIPLDAMKQMDYVWVQFYNNPPCMLGSAGFAASFKAWSQDLGSAKLFIGAPSSSDSAGSGFLDSAALAATIKSVKSVPNFGGVMLWDAARATLNNDFQKGVKQALGS